jgi:endonuclease III
MKAEAAWMIPFLLSERLGTFEFEALRRVSLSRIERLMTKPQPLHRYPAQMALNVHAAIRAIAHKYNGDAAQIWVGRPSSSLVVYRFLEFRGVGPKIASMAANILARRFKVPFSDYYSIDISPDVHVHRVFTRLGLIPKDTSPDALIFRARAAHPMFPGLLDFPAWDIGRQWCRPRTPRCGDCYMSRLCPSATVRQKPATA